MTDIKLYLGDCLDIMKIIPSTSVDLVLVDPPYGVTKFKWDNIIPLEDMWKEIKRIRKDTTPIVIFSKQPYTSILNCSNIKEFKYELIWQKTQATNPMCANKRFMPIHENVSIFFKKFGTYNPQKKSGYKNYKGHISTKPDVLYGEGTVWNPCVDGTRYPTSVLTYQNKRFGYHPTQKPLELIELLVKTYSNEGDTVLDFTMGSGTTGVACKKLNRNFIGIEIDEKYYNISKERIERESNV